MPCRPFELALATELGDSGPLRGDTPVAAHLPDVIAQDEIAARIRIVVPTCKEMGLAGVFIDNQLTTVHLSCIVIGTQLKCVDKLVFTKPTSTRFFLLTRGKRHALFLSCARGAHSFVSSS